MIEFATGLTLPLTPSQNGHEQLEKASMLASLRLYLAPLYLTCNPRPASHLPSFISSPFPLLLLLFLMTQQQQQCMCLQHDSHGPAFLNMEPAISIFGSLLGSSRNRYDNSSASNNIYANQAAHSQEARQSAATADQTSYRDGQSAPDKVTLPGDIILGGLFPIHMKGSKTECGEINRDRGIQRLEAMLYALDRINEDSQLLPDIKLGAILLDSCSSSTYALNQSLEFIRASINTVESSAFECKDKSSPRPKYGSKMIAGVIGGSYSEVSLQVANLLRLFRIPQVSYASTGTALSDKSLYDLFARTVPSDMFQARAIADIVLKLNWSYVSLVSSEGLYGDSGSREFIKQASARRICIAVHEKMSPTSDAFAQDSIVASLVKKNATGVVLFTRAEDTRQLLHAVKRAKHRFAWVAADGWGTHQKLAEGLEDVALGAITVELAAKTIPGFDNYMKGLTPWDNARNPWFNEYWQAWFDCQLQPNLQQQQQQLQMQMQMQMQLRPGQHNQSPNDQSSAQAEPGDGAEPDFSARRRRRQAQRLNQSAGSPLEPADRRGRRSYGAPQADLSAGSAGFLQLCSPNLRISESNGYRQEQKVQFVVDAVYAMAHALHKAWFNLCDGQPGLVCEALKELSGGEFYSKYLLDVSFKDLAGSEVKFDEHGDGLGRYNIYNFRHSLPRQPLEGASNVSSQFEMHQQSPPGGAFKQMGPKPPAPSQSGARSASAGPTALPAGSLGSSSAPINLELDYIPVGGADFEYSPVGRWTEDEYFLQLDDIQFIQGDHQVPESYCSQPCELGQAKIMRSGDHCCWMCKTCAPYEYLPDEFNCLDCGIGQWPIPNKTACFELPKKWLRWDSPISLVSLSIASLGILFTLFVTLTFIKYIDTPVVKASGRELSFILLAGIAFCHLSTFVFMTKPSAIVCGVQRFMANFGFSLMYASLLVKTNRISRIFNCARKSAKRPSFISPKSQMLITGVLVAVQIFLAIVWFVFEPPGTKTESPEGRRDEVILKCRSTGKSFIISLAYNMILITTCTIYAVKTRKIPENFNESKFIGFTMYTTIVIWLAFVTMFFGTNNAFEIQINTICVSISLSAYVTLFCLFSPKISIILLHPDKNVRKLTMNSGAYKQRTLKQASSFSVDGRAGLSPGPGGPANLGQTGAGTDQAGFSSQPDGISGPLSVTSNAPNLGADSMAASRMLESSLVSNAASNSAASQCSLAQKTGSAILAASSAILCSKSQHHHHSGVSSVCARCVSKQTAPSISASSSSGGRINQVDQPQQLIESEANLEAMVTTRLVQRSSILISSSSSCNQQAQIMHSRRSGQPTTSSSSHQTGYTASSEERLAILNKQAHQTNPARQATMAANQITGSASSHPKTPLNRLGEMNSVTTSSQCCGLVDDSISSLANITSQDNTPCMGPLGSSQPAVSSSVNAVAGFNQTRQHQLHQQYLARKGSDSMLWNQSVYSIDYCSDCCPSSYCHCNCPACSSSNGLFTGDSLVLDGLPDSGINSGSRAHHHEHQFEQSQGLSSQAGLARDGAPTSSSICKDQVDANPIQKFSSSSSSHLNLSNPLKSQRSLESGQTEAQYAPVSSKVSSRCSQELASGSSKTKRSQTMEMQAISDAKVQTIDSTANKTASDEESSVLIQNCPARTQSAYSGYQQKPEPTTGGSQHHQSKYIQLTSSKDKLSSERKQVGDRIVHRVVKQRQTGQATGGSTFGGGGQADQSGAIQASIELIKLKAHNRRVEANRRQRQSSCFSYHDDYEYNYGLVHSNSDSENYYHEGDSVDDTETRASSIPCDEDIERAGFADSELSHDKAQLHLHRHSRHHHRRHEHQHHQRTLCDEANAEEQCLVVDNDVDADDDEDERGSADLGHDGRLATNKATQQKRSSVKADRDRWSSGGSGINIKSKSTNSSISGKRSNRDQSLPLNEHRINSVALIAATLSAGGAIIESGSSSSVIVNRQQAGSKPQPTAPTDSIATMSGPQVEDTDRLHQKSQLRHRKEIPIDDGDDQDNCLATL